MASKNPTNFYPQIETRPFLEILHKRLKEKKITWNQFLNAVIPPIAAELSKEENINPTPNVTLDLGVIDLSK